MSAAVQARPYKVARAYWWALLVLSVVVSAYGNVRHAQAAAPQAHALEAAWIGGALPVVLLLMVHGIAVGARAGLLGWRRRVATVIVGALAVVVLASSYVGLLSVVRATQLFDFEVLNLGLAAVPDLLMIAATIYTMALGEPVSEAAQDRDDAEPAEEVWTEAAQAVAQEAEQTSAQPAQVGTEHGAQVVAQVISEHPTEQPAQVETERPVERPTEHLGTAQLPAQLSVQDTAQVDPEGSDLVMQGLPQSDRDWLSSLGSAFDKQTEQPELSAQMSSTEQTEQTPSDPARVAVEHSAQVTPEQPAERPTEHLGTAQVAAHDAPSVDELSEDLDAAQPPAQADLSTAQDVLSLAERAYAQLEPKVSVEVLAELIEASRAGASQRRLGEIAGISPTTATRYVKEAEEM